MCVCVVIYIRVCEVKIFLPFKKRDDWTQNTNTCQVHTFSLSLSFFSLSVSVPNIITPRFGRNKKSFLFPSKEEKQKIESNFFLKKRGFFQESHHFLFLTLLLLRGIILCAYTLKRGLEKREKTSAYKSNNNNNNKRERKKEQFW